VCIVTARVDFVKEVFFMQNPFQLFNHPRFGEVRVARIDGEFWFVGKDVAKALGYLRPDKAIRRHVSDKNKRIWLVPTHGTFHTMRAGGGLQKRRAMLINESGLYALVLASNMPLALEFKSWITDEVLPALRKTGSYTLPALDAPDSDKRIADLEEQLSGLQTLFEMWLAELKKLPPAQERAEKLIALADKIQDETARDKIFLQAANLLIGKKIF